MSILWVFCTPFHTPKGANPALVSRDGKSCASLVEADDEEWFGEMLGKYTLRTNGNNWNDAVENSQSE
jgi:hypothetical protein